MTWKDLSRLLVEHNHPSNEPLLEVIVCWSQVKAEAKAGCEKARSISNWSAAAHNKILSESTCKKTLKIKNLEDVFLNQNDSTNWWYKACGKTCNRIHFFCSTMVEMPILAYLLLLKVEHCGCYAMLQLGWWKVIFRWIQSILCNSTSSLYHLKI